MTGLPREIAGWVGAVASLLLASACSAEEPALHRDVVLEFAPSCGGGGTCDFDLSCLGALSLRAWTDGGDAHERCLRGADLAGVHRGCDLGALDVALTIGETVGPLEVELTGFAAPGCDGPDALFVGGASVDEAGTEIDLAVECDALCEEQPAEVPVVLSFGGNCGDDDGCDLDLSCLGAVSFRIWTADGGLDDRCMTGADLAGLVRGCDLGALDLAVRDVPAGPIAVQLLGFTGTSCAPHEDAAVRVLFDGVASVAGPSARIDLRLHCTAGCAAGTDPCDDADSCDCCAGVCVSSDAMLHCGGCFVPCDPFRANRCSDGACQCGATPACAPSEVCCADGTCAAIGRCAPASCPFGAGGDCTDPTDDEDACGGGLGADSCSESRSDGCVAGGCTCGGEPSCGDPGYCWEGTCVD